MLIDVWQDVRFGVRMLVKNPGFSLVVIAVLTLGIAGNAAIFSLFKGLALKPLPGVRDSATSSVLLGRTIDGRGIGISVPDYRDIAAQQQSFESLTASMMIFASLGRGVDAQRVTAELVIGNYFEALGVQRATRAAPCCRQTMWRRDSIRWRSSATRCGDGRLPPIPRFSARPST